MFCLDTTFVVQEFLTMFTCFAGCILDPLNRVQKKCTFYDLTVKYIKQYIYSYFPERPYTLQ